MPFMVPLIVLVEISWGHAYGSQENPWPTAPQSLAPPERVTGTLYVLIAQKENLLFDQNII